jgi:hypothetical protein
MAQSIEDIIASTVVPPPSVLELAELEQNVISDQLLLQWYFRRLGMNQQIVASTSFLAKSSDTYNNPEWLAREIAQNFVDHNPVAPETINGVEMTVVPGEPSEFTIVGRWPYDNPSALFSPHSEKPKRHTGGGNGVAMKQISMICLRDMGVSEFSVYGTDWHVQYNIVPAQLVNDRLTSWGVAHTVSTDWLCALVRKTEPRNHCMYRIVTDNSEMMDAFSAIPFITVGDQNPFLRSPTFSNENGALVWHKDNPQQGRIFINGQAMRYDQREFNEGETRDYWGSLGGVSIRLNDLDYEMSIDRPPMQNYLLSRYTKSLLDTMSTDDLFSQLAESRFLWEGYTKSDWSQKGSVEIVEAIVSTLQYRGDYDQSRFAEAFGEKMLACNISEREQKKLQKDGYIFCPKFFSRIGVPEASTLLKDEHEPRNNRPRPTDYDAEAAASGIGIVVGRAESSFKDALARLKKLGGSLYFDNGEYVITMPQEINEKLLSHPLHTPTTRSQQGLYALRTVIGAGLEECIIEDVVTSHSGIITTYSLADDPILGNSELWIRNTKALTSEGIEFRFKSEENIEELWAPSHWWSRKKEEVSALPVRAKEIPSPDEEPERVVQRDEYRREFHMGERLAGYARAAMVVATIGLAGFAVKQLDFSGLRNVSLGDLFPESPKVEQPGKDFDIYAQWREISGYGSPTDGKGLSLRDIISQYEQADIPADSKREKMSEAIAKWMAAAPQQDHDIENFAIVQQPTPTELQQLALLRDTFQARTGYHIPNKLFIFTGNGTKGVNMGRESIGLHRGLFETEFEEAYTVLNHEVAHNYLSEHDEEFERTTRALFGRSNAKQSDLLLRLRQRQPIAPYENAVILAPYQWEVLRAR